MQVLINKKTGNPVELIDGFAIETTTPSLIEDQVSMVGIAHCYPDIIPFNYELRKASLAFDSTLPSRFQINDSVKLNFGDSGTVTNCKIIKVHFTESKVLYDVEVKGNFNHLLDTVDHEDLKINNTWYTRLYNVDSCFVDLVN